VAIAQDAVSVEWHLGLGEFDSRVGEEFFAAAGIQRRGGSAADCEHVAVQRGAVFSDWLLEADGFGCWRGFRW